MQLLLQATWKADPAALLLTQQRVFNLIDLFSECASLPEPFSCQANFFLSGSPFGSFSAGCVGSYNAGFGWDSTDGTCGSSDYQGVDVDVDLGALFHLTTIGFRYSLVKDGAHPGLASNLIFVYDVDNAAFLGTPLTGTDTVDGVNQIFSTGPISATTRHLRFFAAAGIDTIGTPISGSALISAATIDGDSTGPGPC